MVPRDSLFLRFTVGMTICNQKRDCLTMEDLVSREALLSAVREDFNSEHPDAVEHLEKLAVDHNQDLSGGKSKSSSATSCFSRSSSASRR